MAIRGLFTINGRSFSVASTAFLEVMSNGSTTLRGTVGNDGFPVSMAASPQQLLLASAGVAYIFDLVANTFSPIPGATFAGPVAQVGICTDFFLVLVANSKEFYVSAVLDATDWTSNGAAIVDVFPDNIVSMIVDHNEIWFFSDTQRAVYGESPTDIFPFVYIQGSFGETGSGAQYSTAQLNDSVFWMGRNARGSGIVLRSQGYSQARVSNHAIEFAIQGYSKIDDAIALTYQDQGHEFYQIYFPTPSKTWTYDTATGWWHERGFWLQSIGAFRAAHYQNHTFNFGKHLVGDWSSDNIYEMSIPVHNGSTWTFADDNGNPIRRVRRAPHISNEQKWQYFSELQVFLESGLGPIPGLQGQAPPSSIILQDSLGNLWQVTVLDSGLLDRNIVTSGTAQTVFLNDTSNAKTWLLGINTVGQLTTTAQVFDPTKPQSYPLVSVSGHMQYLLQIIPLDNLQTSASQIFTRAPQMTLRWSDDSHTWSNEYSRDCGQAGEYKKRVIWRRLGRSRDRIFEISVSDPIGWRVIDGYAQFQVASE